MENSLTKLDVKTLIDKNMELGYDETDAIIVTYDDIKEMQKGTIKDGKSKSMRPHPVLSAALRLYHTTGRAA